MAPTVIHASNKSMFIIRVQYYVQVTLCFGMLHRDISIRLPFLLRRMEERKLVTDQAAAVAANAEKANQQTPTSVAEKEEQGEDDILNKNVEAIVTQPSS